MLIVIDPGHGGTENKNVGYSGKYREHVGNLEYCLKLAKYIKMNGMDCILTRDEDTNVSITERSEVAVNNKADVFISIHSDAGEENAKGSTVFYSVNHPTDKNIAISLAKTISESYNTKYSVRTRPSENRAGRDYYGVIDRTANDSLYKVPYVFLIERAFHSNKDEELLLLDKTVSDRSAKALADKLKDIFNMHWGQKYWNWLNENGVEIHDTRFNDPITRAEVFALIARSRGCKL